MNEIGVYYKDHTRQLDRRSSRRSCTSSRADFIKSTVTHGIIKEDQNGHINGPRVEAGAAAADRVSDLCA